MSKVQAAVISAGTELEKTIVESCKKKGTLINDLDLFLDRPPAEIGVWVAPKKVVKKSRYSYKKEPDFLVFVHGLSGTRDCLVVELKEGDAFDTKKAAGEVEMLKEFQNHIAAKIPYRTELRICCFYVPNRARVVEAFKRAITEDMALTGEEFCGLLGLDYRGIIRRRSADQAANLDYFAERLGGIEAVRKRLSPIFSRRRSEGNAPDSDREEADSSPQ